MPIIEEVKSLHERLEARPVLGKGSIVVTDMRSSAPSLCAVPDLATIHLDRRLTQGETMASCLEEIKKLDSVKKTDAAVHVPAYDVRSYTGLIRKVSAYYPLWVMDDDHPLTETAIRAYEILFR